MADRPYFSKSVSDLQVIFERSKSDWNELGRLDHELAQRTTKAALALAAQVSVALEEFEAKKVVSIVGTGRNEASVPPAQIPRTAAAAAATAIRQPKAQPVGTTPVDLGPLPTYRPSGKRDEPSSILAAWTALEALSPQSYKRPEDLAAGDRSRLVPFDRGIPWGPNAKSKPKYRLYFQVMLGAVALDKATDELVKVFGEDEERSRPDNKKAAIGAILVDKEGYVVEDNGIAVSSFAWALRPALKLELGSLGAWTYVEKAIIDRLDKMVRRFDEDGNPIPLDMATIQSAHRWLVEQFDIPRDLVEAPSFSLKVFHHLKAKNPPEASLLNSFYLEDLSLASKLVTEKRCGPGLSGYLGINPPTARTDLLSPAPNVEPWVAPSLMPSARWPSDGGHPLVMLQQAAVNAARHELKDSAGIIGVNGPPGTGKTTLLRDVVVGCVLDRASAMVKFADPASAFSTTGEKLSFGPAQFMHFYRLDPSLKGHEIVVASSNNKAVQNVSQELPRKKANGRPDDFAYFRSISDLIANPRRAGVDDDDDAPVETVETWGLAAAVLGNGGNRWAFQQTFWWDEDRGFRTYLRAARGDNVVREIKDPETDRVIAREIPSVVTTERPSVTAADAQAAWRGARSKFTSLKKEIDAELASLETVRQACLALPSAIAKFRQLNGLRQEFVEAEVKARDDLDAATSAEASVSKKFAKASKVAEHHRHDRPGFFSRLFNTAKWKAWDARNRELGDELRDLQKQTAQAESRVEQIERQLSAAKQKLAQHEVVVRNAEAEARKLDLTVSEARKNLGGRIVDAKLFASGHEQIHLTAPWLPDHLHRKRENLFGAALDVQKAFVDASAKHVYHNLSLVMTAFTAGALQSPNHKALLGDLWSTLFMVVPAVSTTFASIRSMFGDLGPETIGWLLIDEAGQALPQAAVGAVMRARRSIVVGDPLQIPPVVSLPERLTLEICKFFDVDHQTWAAPIASTQTLADSASNFRSSFSTENGDREVGLPLLVHRRCQNPMFDVSNSIAYAGQMVHAVGPRVPGPIGDVLGRSQWIDINGHADSKWCPDEGEAVVRLLGRLASASVMSPDLFIISPFKIVVQEMGRRLEREQALFRSLGVAADKWVGDRVGTVHTFQGREANTVILLLGAPKAEQHRARLWAGSPPNILNVAVSRAKQNLYVVGSKAAWSGAGRSFQTLVNHLG